MVALAGQVTMAQVSMVSPSLPHACQSPAKASGLPSAEVM